MRKYLFNKLNIDLIIFSVLIFVTIPLNLSRDSNVPYNLELIISLILLASIFSVILILFSFLIIKIPFQFNIFPKYSFVIGFVLVWTFLTGNFFPVSGIPGPFLNLDLSLKLRYIIIIKIILIFLFYLFLFFKDKKKFFFRFIYFFVIANILILFLNVQNDKNQKPKNSLSEFGKKNLIVLSFDGISGHKIYEEIIKDENLNKNLKDFKLFKNTVTGAPFTWPSINLEINGKIKFKSELKDNILDKKDINTLVYSTYKTALFDKKKGISDGELQEYNSSFKLNNFFQTFLFGSIGRWATPIGLILVDPIKYKKFYKDFIDLISLNQTDKLNPYDHIKTTININLFEYDLIFDNISYNKNLNKVIRMYHFIFSHWPITINENCEEVEFLDPKLISFDHEQVVIKCVSKKIIKFLNNLRNKNLYDNSMIVIKSDHGKPNCIRRTYTKKKITDFFKQNKCEKYYKQYPYNEKINNNYYWGFGRYKVFVLIKKQNQINNEIVISDKQIFLHDLSSTYCNFFYESDQCDHINKNDLTKKENNFKINDYEIYIPKIEKPLSTTKFQYLKKYTMFNNMTFLDFLKSNKSFSSD